MDWGSISPRLQGRIWAGAAVRSTHPGDPAELGYWRGEIDDLCAGKVVLDAADPNAVTGI